MGQEKLQTQYSLFLIEMKNNIEIEIKTILNQDNSSVHWTNFFSVN